MGRVTWIICPSRGRKLLFGVVVSQSRVKPFLKQAAARSGEPLRHPNNQKQRAEFFPHPASRKRRSRQGIHVTGIARVLYGRTRWSEPWRICEIEKLRHIHLSRIPLGQCR